MPSKDRVKKEKRKEKREKTREQDCVRKQKERNNASEEEKMKIREKNGLKMQETREKSSQLEKENTREKNRLNMQLTRSRPDFTLTALSAEQLVRKRHNESVRQIHVQFNDATCNAPYHEVQELGYCAVHAVNMALGKRAVSYEMLMESAIDNAVMFQQLTNNLTPHICKPAQQLNLVANWASFMAI
jgi:hypothetical protein